MKRLIFALIFLPFVGLSQSLPTDSAAAGTALTSNPNLYSKGVNVSNFNLFFPLPGNPTKFVQVPTVYQFNNTIGTAAQALLNNAVTTNTVQSITARKSISTNDNANATFTLTNSATGGYNLRTDGGGVSRFGQTEHTDYASFGSNVGINPIGNSFEFTNFGGTTRDIIQSFYSGINYMALAFNSSNQTFGVTNQGANFNPIALLNSSNTFTSGSNIFTGQIRVHLGVASGTGVAGTNNTFLSNSSLAFQQSGGVSGVLGANTLTGANKTWNLPDASGTIALTSDIPTPLQIVEISGTTQTASTNTAYIPHNASQTTITAPSATTIGSLIQIIGEGAGGWKLQLPAGYSIKGVGGFTTTSGGSVASTDRYCTITIRLVATNTFVVTTSQGTLTPL